MWRSQKQAIFLTRQLCWKCLQICINCFRRCLTLLLNLFLGFRSLITFRSLYFIFTGYLWFIVSALSCCFLFSKHSTTKHQNTDLIDFLQPYSITAYHLRSSGQTLLKVQRTYHKTFGDRTFPHSGPSLWNDLPLDIRSSPTVTVFKSKLKTYLFNSLSFFNILINTILSQLLVRRFRIFLYNFSAI